MHVCCAEFCDIGVVTSLEFDNEPVELAKAGQEVCIKIDAAGGDKKYFGRHFDETDELVSRVRPQTLCFRDRHVAKDIPCTL